ncbi:MAG: nuclear transport factor 2 family protein [Pseudobdellovibrio sp.]
MGLQTANTTEKKQAPKTAAETEVRQRMNDFVTAFKSMNVDKIMSFYADDVVAFDVAAPLQIVGKAAYKKSWEDVMPMMKSAELFEMSAIKVHTSGDLALFHCLTHSICTGAKDGKKMDSWMRYTGGLKKINGTWLVIHEQLSFPIDMETNKALMELKPEPSVIH